MNPYEFMRVCHPKLGMFVHKHKGTGIIVDNIFKPMRKILSPIVKNITKQSGKKALKSGVSNLSKRVNKRKSEKSGDMIMEKLKNMRIGDVIQKDLPLSIKKKEESTDMIINRLISGSGVKRKSNVKFM